MKFPEKSVEELALREYQELVVGVLMQAGVIRRDGTLDDQAVSAYEHAVTVLKRDGLIREETYIAWFRKRKRLVFSYEAWRALNDRIGELSRQFNAADRAVPSSMGVE